jgi:hypothetical protein
MSGWVGGRAGCTKQRATTFSLLLYELVFRTKYSAIWYLLPHFQGPPTVHNAFCTLDDTEVQRVDF